MMIFGAFNFYWESFFSAPWIAADTGLRLRPAQYERIARPGAQKFIRKTNYISPNRLRAPLFISLCTLWLKNNHRERKGCTEHTKGKSRFDPTL